MPTRMLCSWVCLLVCGVISADDKPKADEKAIQGTWVLVEQSKPAEPVILCERIVFKDDKLTFHYKFNDKPFTTECSFKLDSSTNPRAIDFSPVDGDGKGKKYLGLYALKDGQLLFCYRGPGSTRPKGFDDKSAGNDVTTYYVFDPAPKK